MLTCVQYYFSFNRTLLDRAVESFNVQYGSQNQVISNAIFSFGELDPFLDHGITEYNVETSEVAGTSCNDIIDFIHRITEVADVHYFIYIF